MRWNPACVLIVCYRNFQKMTEKKKKGWRREIIEWGIFLGVIGILFFTGLHTEVIGGMQRLILKIGLITPNVEQREAAYPLADYNFTITSVENNESVSFVEFKDKVVFLNFWATWCPPCIAEMPNIQSLYENVDHDDIVFVMLSVDDELQKARDFIDKKGFTFPTYHLKNPIPSVFSSESIPTTFVISPKGEVVLKKSGMAQYDNEKFRQFLKELADG